MRRSLRDSTKTQIRLQKMNQNNYIFLTIISILSSFKVNYLQYKPIEDQELNSVAFILRPMNSAPFNVRQAFIAFCED